MNIKLIALDMDGTALTTEKTMLPKTTRVLRAAAQRGIHIVPATGRVRKLIPRPILDVGSIRYAITANGATVLDLEKETVLYENLLTEEQSNRLIDYLMGCNVLVEAYTGGDSYVDKKHLELIPTFKDYPQIFVDMFLKYQTPVDDLPNFLKKGKRRLEKINIPYMEPDVREMIWNELSKKQEFALTSSFSNNIEINRASANKGDGLRHLCERLGIKPEEVIAFGDETNDLRMLEFAGCGVAMQNGCEEAKQAADFVTLSNDEDGIPYALEKIAGIKA